MIRFTVCIQGHGSLISVAVMTGDLLETSRCVVFIGGGGSDGIVISALGCL